MNNVLNQIIDDYKVLYENEKAKRKDYQQRIDKALDMLIVVYGGNDEYYVKTIEKARNILQNGSEDNGYKEN